MTLLANCLEHCVHFLDRSIFRSDRLIDHGKRGCETEILAKSEEFNGSIALDLFSA